MIPFLTAGCGKEDKTGSVEIAFMAQYGNSPLVLLSDYDYAGNQKIRFSHLDYYISDLELVMENGDVAALSEIDLIDLDFSSAQQSVAGNSRLYLDIPAGKYNKIRFGVGVKPSLNTTQPSDHLSSNPLSESSHYWEGWTSYIFSKTEGNLDQDGDGIYDLGFTIHSGSSDVVDLYRSLEAQPSFEVVDGEMRSIQLILDYRKLLAVDEEGLDIASTPHTNDPNEMELITAMANNYAEAFLISIP
jgi:hypothetical protein